MTAWEVKDYLAQLTDWEDSQEENILALCRACLKEIEAMLRPDAEHTDVRIAAAAASLAYYKLMLKRSTTENSEEITNFKAGDVSITQTNADSSKLLDRAEKLYRDALGSIIPLCRDNGFAFRNVLIKVKI
ncbi:MAG: hypothetical protein IKT61_01850 [Clostridia bacterium]|nr:hypothetical protein [Clostridia bacterium]